MPDLAINGGSPVRTAPYPPWPAYDDRERQGLMEVLESRDWWSSQGTKVRAFETAFGQMCGGAPAVAATNGTETLAMALSALGIGEGDEVVVPDWTFFATISAVLEAGADPVIVDVEPGTGCIDVDQVQAVIGPRTAGVVAVHVAGHPADLDRLVDLCERHGLALLEDCAHAHGSAWRDRHVGMWGDAGSFSFQASKLMTGGEGGAIVSHRDEVLERCRSLVNCGRRPGVWYYRHFALAGNHRMTEWQGAILLAQLERFGGQQEVRAANANRLNAALAEVPGVHPQERDPRCTSQGNYCYLARIEPEAFGASRDAVREALLAEGIPLTTAYPPLHRLELFAMPDGLAPRRRDRSGMQDFPSLELPVTDRLARDTLWFTTAVLMGTAEDAGDVVAALSKIQEHAEELPA
jgi:dTDP-4-amino-4,6-dideoxygalactose transaminase